MMSRKMRSSPWSSSTGKVKARAKRREHAGIAVKAVTTTEIARVTNRTTAGQMTGHERIRKAARQAKMQAKSIGTTCETARAKAEIGTGTAGPKRGKSQAD